MADTGVMAAEWKFLEPWYTAIKDNLTSERIGEASALRVSFRIVQRHQTQDIFVNIPVDEDSRQNLAQLQHLRETLELFTILSVVNNMLFTKLFLSDPGNQQIPSNVHTYNYPTWQLCLVGTLASNDFAAIQSPVSWGTLLGFPIDPSGYSAEFRAALERLRGLGIEEASKEKLCYSHKAHWICDFQDSRIVGTQAFSTSADGLDFVAIGLHKLLNAHVPPVFQYHATRSKTELIETYQKDRLSLGTTSKSVVADIFDITKDFPKLTAALAVSNITSLSLSFHLLFQRMVDVPQITINAGFFFNTFLCGQSLVIECENMDTSSDFIPTQRLTNEELTLSCSSRPDCVFSATCSAVAEISSEAHLSDFYMPLENAGPNSWSWLIYALCCGTSSIDIPSVGIGRACLTKSDLLDSESTVPRKKHVTGTLTLDYVKVENSTLLMDLLAVATYNLRELSLREDEENENPLDLAVLSAVCPDLQKLYMKNVTVLVSSHNKFLCRWPIKQISISKTHSISDLKSCLNDRNLRMFRELLKLEVWRPIALMYSEMAEEADLKFHDGEFLPVTKEMLPFLSKAAMISIVTSAGTSKAVHRLDAHILSFIFKLAATPAQRSVHCSYTF